MQLYLKGSSEIMDTKDYSFQFNIIRYGDGWFYYTLLNKINDKGLIYLNSVNWDSINNWDSIRHLTRVKEHLKTDMDVHVPKRETVEWIQLTSLHSFKYSFVLPITLNGQRNQLCSTSTNCYQWPNCRKTSQYFVNLHCENTKNLLHTIAFAMGAEF